MKAARKQIVLTAVSLAAVATLATGGIALASDTSKHTNLIHACVFDNGQIRIMRQCTGDSYALSWNRQGPVGPRGLKGSPGPRGTSARRCFRRQSSSPECCDIALLQSPYHTRRAGDVAQVSGTGAVGSDSIDGLPRTWGAGPCLQLQSRPGRRSASGACGAAAWLSTSGRLGAGCARFGSAA